MRVPSGPEVGEITIQSHNLRTRTLCNQVGSRFRKAYDGRDDAREIPRFACTRAQKQRERLEGRRQTMSRTQTGDFHRRRVFGTIPAFFTSSNLLLWKRKHQ